MSRNTTLTSTVEFLSKAFCMSRIIESGWAIHKSPGRKPDCEKLKSVLLRK